MSLLASLRRLHHLRHLRCLSACAFLCWTLLGAAGPAHGDAPAPAVLLAQDYSSAVDPGHYWVSEKLDGVRALWDGRTLRFRSGREIHAPAWFTAGFPAHALDGELWMGRRRFDQTSAAVRREEPLDAEWKQISYQVFEWPGASGTFTERLQALQASVHDAKLAWLVVVPQYRVADRPALQAKLDAVVRAGGEGLMLHRADASWESGRSSTLLKYKPQHDAEAVVVAHLPGKGKYRDMLGALLVETPEGQRFRIGSGFTDAQRSAPPAIGSTITYRYRERTAKGLPRFATFLRVRHAE
ncbi:MAG TPA: DNA ligase [Noviherbaspirillum sp.]